MCLIALKEGSKEGKRGEEMDPDEDGSGILGKRSEAVRRRASCVRVPRQSRAVKTGLGAERAFWSSPKCNPTEF